jgi:hypothetical protein
MFLPLRAHRPLQLDPRPLGQPSKLCNVRCEDTVGVPLDQVKAGGNEVETTAVNDQGQAQFKHMLQGVFQRV